MNIHDQSQSHRVSTAAQQQVAALLHETVEDAKSSRLENSNNI